MMVDYLTLVYLIYLIVEEKIIDGHGSQLLSLVTVVIDLLEKQQGFEVKEEMMEESHSIVDVEIEDIGLGMAVVHNIVVVEDAPLLAWAVMGYKIEVFVAVVVDFIFVDIEDIHNQEKTLLQLKY